MSTRLDYEFDSPGNAAAAISWQRPKDLRPSQTLKFDLDSPSDFNYSLATSRPLQQPQIFYSGTGADPLVNIGYTECVGP